MRISKESTLDVLNWEKFFWLLFKINTHDIELVLVMFREIYKIVILHFKWHLLVQNGHFSEQKLLEKCKIRKFRPTYGTLKF